MLRTRPEDDDEMRKPDERKFRGNCAQKREDSHLPREEIQLAEGKKEAPTNSKKKYHQRKKHAGGCITLEEKEELSPRENIARETSPCTQIQ